MIQAYLILNALLYAVFAAACTLMPEKAARAVGFELPGGSGRSEFVTVYGGLELAMALFFAIGAWRAEWREGALLFAVLLYGCLVVFRIGTLIAFEGIGRLTYLTFGLELVLGVAGAALWVWARPTA